METKSFPEGSIEQPKTTDFRTPEVKPTPTDDLLSIASQIETPDIAGVADKIDTAHKISEQAEPELVSGQNITQVMSFKELYRSENFKGLELTIGS